MRNNTNFCIFKYKLLLNILYLNKMLYKSEKSYPHFFLCMEEPESLIHLVQKQTLSGHSYILSKKY